MNLIVKNGNIQKYYTVVSSGYVKGYDVGEAVINYGIFDNKEAAINDCRRRWKSEIKHLQKHLVQFDIKPIPGGGMLIDQVTKNGKHIIGKWYVNEIMN